MSRRSSARPAAGAFQAALRRAAPRTPLAVLQTTWAEVVGERIAAAAQPTSERERAVTVECADAVWAQELDMMRTQLESSLRERLGDDAPASLRFRAKGTPA